MFHVFSRRAYCLIAVGIVIGLPVYRTSDVCAQDANAASMAELQQRVQDLEAIVRQLKEGGAGNPASTQPVSVTYTDPAFPAAPPVGTLANAGAAPAAPLAAPLANAGAGAADPPATNAPFVGWNNGFFLRVARQDLPVADHGPNPGRFSRIPAIPSTRPRPPIRPPRAARRRAARIRSSSAARGSASRPRWPTTTSFACCRISPGLRSPNRSPTPT